MGHHHYLEQITGLYVSIFQIWIVFQKTKSFFVLSEYIY